MRAGVPQNIKIQDICLALPENHPYPEWHVTYNVLSHKKSVATDDNN